MRARTIAFALLLMPACAAAQAQADASASPAPPLPDIGFSADVRMRSIEFAGDPGVRLHFVGGPRLDTRHDVERDGLPAPVQAGRTYRGVTVRTTLGATLLDPALDATVGGGAAPATPPSPPTDEDSR